jgi:hypothetical protein
MPSCFHFSIEIQSLIDAVALTLTVFGVTFSSILREDSAETVLLGQRTDRVTHSRVASGPFEIDPARSTASVADIGKLYGNLDSNVSSDDFLRFHFRGLSAIARGGNSPARRWLADYLERVPETAESRQLKVIMVAR